MKRLHRLISVIPLKISYLCLSIACSLRNVLNKLIIALTVHTAIACRCTILIEIEVD